MRFLLFLLISTSFQAEGFSQNARKTTTPIAIKQFVAPGSSSTLQAVNQESASRDSSLFSIQNKSITSSHMGRLKSAFVKVNLNFRKLLFVCRVLQVEY